MARVHVLCRIETPVWSWLITWTRNENENKNERGSDELVRGKLWACLLVAEYKNYTEFENCHQIKLYKNLGVNKYKTIRLWSFCFFGVPCLTNVKMYLIFSLDFCSFFIHLKRHQQHRLKELWHGYCALAVLTNKRVVFNGDFVLCMWESCAVKSALVKNLYLVLLPLTTRRHTHQVHLTKSIWGCR